MARPGLMKCIHFQSPSAEEWGRGVTVGSWRISTDSILGFAFPTPFPRRRSCASLGFNTWLAIAAGDAVLFFINR
jgi:hypothetical protein